LPRDDRVSLTVVGADGCNGAGAVRTLTAASLAGLGDGCGRSVVGRRLVAVVVSTALVSACAGGSKNAAPTAGNKVDRSRAAALETAVRAYSTVVLDGESAKAYTLLSKRCRERMTEAAFEKIATGGAALYGTARLKTLRITQLSGDLARVTYTYDKAAINQTAEPWVYEGGTWREDDC